MVITGVPSTYCPLNFILLFCPIKGRRSKIVLLQADFQTELYDDLYAVSYSSAVLDQLGHPSPATTKLFTSSKKLAPNLLS
jgi:hypothetical protein